MKCKECKNKCIKKGFQQCKFIKKQRYLCHNCGKYQLEDYTYKLLNPKHNRVIIQLNAEGNSVSGMARILECSKQSIIRRIRCLANKVKLPFISEYGQVYEVDELWTFVGDKIKNPVWITFAMNRSTHQVVSYSIGNRSKEDLNKVISPLKMLHPNRIVTDKLNVYPNLVTPKKHDTRKHQNNHIERANLTLRQHLKRLSRKTLAYSKSLEMLEASFKLYLYWNSWKISDFRK